MSRLTPLILLACTVTACQPEADRIALGGTSGATSAPPIAAIRVSDWVATNHAPRPAPVVADKPRTPNPELEATPEPIPELEATLEPIPELAPTPEPIPEPTLVAEPEPETTLVAEPEPETDPTPEPETTPTLAAETEPEVAPKPAARSESDLAITPEDLPTDLIQRFARSAKKAELEAARRLNKQGLDKHRREDIDGAIALYEEALTRAPTHVFSRYNLACAFALQRRDVESLHHLAILAHLAHRDTPARDRLAAARIDADFEHIKDDPRFRALTLATTLQVTWAADTATTATDHELARAVHKQLRDARWDSQFARSPWRATVGGSTIKVRIDGAPDPITQQAARDIQTLLDAENPGRFTLELGAPLPSTGPMIVIVLASTPNNAPDTATSRPDIAPSTRPDDALATRLAPLLGRRLTSHHDTLELRATGFFTWKHTTTTATHARQGRWTLAGKTLELTYSERITSGDPPSLEVLDDRASTHHLEVTDTALTLDDQTFR